MRFGHCCWMFSWSVVSEWRKGRSSRENTRRQTERKHSWDAGVFGGVRASSCRARRLRESVSVGVSKCRYVRAYGVGDGEGLREEPKRGRCPTRVAVVAPSAHPNLLHFAREHLPRAFDPPRSTSTYPSCTTRCGPSDLLHQTT